MFPIGLFCLALVKLQEALGENSVLLKQEVLASLVAACHIDGSRFDCSIPNYVNEIRSQKPFVDFSLDDELLVYTTYQKLLIK